MVTTVNSLSIVIPSFDDGDHVQRLVATIRSCSIPVEIIVSECGETGYFPDLPADVRKCACAEKGRGAQLNAGAGAATGDYLLFLHADSRVTEKALAQLRVLAPSVVGGCLTQKNTFRFVSDRSVVDHYLDAHCGGFRIPHWIAIAIYYTLTRLTELRIYYRTYVIKRVYGDQGIFVRADIFRDLGGYRNMPVFEDAEFFQRLRVKGPIRVLSGILYTYPRKYIEIGMFNYCRLCLNVTSMYKRGDPAGEIAAFYRDTYSKLKR